MIERPRRLPLQSHRGGRFEPQMIAEAGGSWLGVQTHQSALLMGFQTGYDESIPVTIDGGCRGVRSGTEPASVTNHTKGFDRS